MKTPRQSPSHCWQQSVGMDDVCANEVGRWERTSSYGLRPGVKRSGNELPVSLHGPGAGPRDALGQSHASVLHWAYPR